MCNDNKILFVGNYKGGVGKTTTVLNLAKWFSYYIKLDDAKKSILLLDLDPQGSLSEILVNNNTFNRDLYDNELVKVPNHHTINYIFDISIRLIRKKSIFVPKFNDVPIHYCDHEKEFDFIPCSMFYKSTDENIGIGLDDMLLLMEDSVEYYQILPNFINSIKDIYDYIIIDCPPTNNLITYSTFLMSNWYVIPTICDGLSTNGVIHYIQKIKNIYKKICINSVDADINKMIFGEEPQCAGIFYNLIRAQVNYIVEKNNLESELLKQLNMDNIILDGVVNNYIDTARKTPKGIADAEDFKKIVEAIYKKIK